MREDFISVGIDIGTSTTQLVFSRLTIENTASSFSVPRISIVDKEIIYRSEIYFTPLLSATRIDAAGVMKLVEQEYEKAGIPKKDIKVGAVIITGETARKENANEVLSALSGFAGDFVVATAGPDLESIIAAKGAGADENSKRHSWSTLHLDIGGGTTNIAVFDRGDLVDTACLDIGGRLVKLDRETGTVTYINEKLLQVIEEEHIPIALGEKPTLQALKTLTERMTQFLEMAVGLREKDKWYPLILTHKGLKEGLVADSVSFSGGVADYIYGGVREEDVLRYGDIGILLGRAIQESGLLSSLPRESVKETIRATVVGAGSHTTEISGSTITYTREQFPIKNLPIVKLTEGEVEQERPEAIREKIQWFQNEGEEQNVALAFTGIKKPTFGKIETISQWILQGAKELVQKGYPLIVMIEKDIAKAVGQTLVRLSGGTLDLVCIDGIRVENGDYVDIGSPLADGSVLPVVIKTLVFDTKQ